MNRFYHSQSHRKQKHPNVSIDASVKSVLFEIKFTWLDLQPAESCLPQDLTRMPFPIS